jgi:subtilase family serine protease
MRRRSGYRVSGALLITAAALIVPVAGAAQALSVPAAGAGGSPLVPVSAAPAWVGHAEALGAAPAGQRETVTVYLSQPHAAAAERFAAAVSDPRSPLYRHFLTPAQYRSRFAPSAVSVAAVSGYLRAQGLRIAPVPANHLYVRASGTVIQLQKAFHTTLMIYRAGAVHAVAPTGAARLPASVAADVAGVTGLDTRVTATVRTGPAYQAAAGTVACSAYAFQNEATLPSAYGRTTFPTQGCGYTPAQIQGAYDTAGLLAHGVNGHGVKVAVFLFYPTPTAASDIDMFAAGHGLPQLAPGQFTQVLPPSFNYGPSSGCPPLPAVEQESVGDLESVHEMAPGADLVYVAAPDCLPQDILATINQTVDNRLADIVTNSWTLVTAGVPAAVRDAAHQAYLQAAAEGMSWFYASGDGGDLSTALGTPHSTWPASDPAVTGVGGTSLFVGPGDNREGELGWGMTLDPVVTNGATAAYALPLPGQFAGGSGGGPAPEYAQPAYQAGVVPASLAGVTDPRRVVPDVAAAADLATPVLFGITIGGTYIEGGGGGTSVSSPLFAGLQALTDQAAGGPLGFINPAIYLLHGTGILHDITAVPAPVAFAVSSQGTTYLDTLQADTSLTAAPGYDDQTGLGSPDGAVYVSVLSLLRRSETVSFAVCCRRS